MRTSKGFTLIELLVVILVLGAVAGLALPNYSGVMERSRANEARANLDLIYMGQKIYRINNGTYWNGGECLSVAPINGVLGLDISAVYYTKIDVTANGGASYTAKFTRNDVSGGHNTKYYQDNYTFGAFAPVRTEGGAF